MAEIYIFLSSFTALLFIITRKCFIGVTYLGEWSVEIHFTFFALRLGGSDRSSSDKRKRDEKSGGRPPWEFYRRLIARIRRLLTVSDVYVGRMMFPLRDSELSCLRNARLRWAIGAALAYIETEARSLTVKDNAFDFNSDSRAFEFDITARLATYSLLRFAIAVLYDLIKFKHAKRKKKYVGK